MLFGKDENRRREDVLLPSTERGAKSLGIEIPSGPGMHGFSGRHPESVHAEAQAAEFGGHEENGRGQQEDIGMVSGANGHGESLPAGLTFGSDIERLAEAVGRLSDADEQEISPVFSEEPAPDPSPAPETPGRTIMLVHHSEHGALKVDSFDNERQAMAFVEELLSRGVDRGTIEAYRASRLDYDVSFRPVVHFKRA